MRIFVMGGTGSIGSAVVRTLVSHGHDVLGLSRSPSSASALQRLGASALPGDIRHPERWLGQLMEVDGVIHAAADFSDDMGEIDSRLIESLLPVLGTMQRPLFIYTGGCWLYGTTCDEAATEASPFDPLPAFAWMVPNLKRVLSAPEVDGRVIHPAMVYDRSGGVLTSFIEHARSDGPVPVVGGEHIRWPLVHADDFAELYHLVLTEGKPGHAYNGAAIASLPVGQLASDIARRIGGLGRRLKVINVDAIAAQRGEWARGYAIDQAMCGEKARRELRWQPVHRDPVDDVLSV